MVFEAIFPKEEADLGALIECYTSLVEEENFDTSTRASARPCSSSRASCRLSLTCPK